MNKRQLEVEKAKLREEKKLLKELKKIYEDAAKEVEQKIRISNGKIDLLLSVFDELDDKQKSLLKSQIYQKKFQENLKKQLDELIGNLDVDSYDSITRYLTDSYYTGYIGTMYDIQGQGIPLITPINEKQVTSAMTLNTKLSVPLYTRMGIDVGVLKKQIAKHISRGIATSSSYAHIARNIDGASNIGFNKAMRIARTEGHRIQVLGANDAQHAAKAKGCEVVKQWDATLDGRTRPMHRLLDGKLAEIDEPFVVDDIEVMYPGGFGIASQDVNCRCALLQRARWALDADELKTLKERAEYYGLDKTEDFEDYKRKYLKVIENKQYSDIMESELGLFKKKLKKDSRIETEYYIQLKKKFSQGKADAKKLFNKYASGDTIEDAFFEGTPHYNVTTKKISMHYGVDLENVRGIGATWFHEHGHLIDDFAGNVSDDEEYLSLLQEDLYNYLIKYGKTHNLESIDLIVKAISLELNDMRMHSAVSDIFEGLTDGQVQGCAGHSLKYWENPINITSEAFAHMFESEFDVKRYNEMKKYFPQALKYFERKIKVI